MATSANSDGGPAFPRITQLAEQTDQDGNHLGYYVETADGMSLRDFFAAHAPEQISDRRDAEKTATFCGIKSPDRADWLGWMQAWIDCEAILRYRYADAMMRAREVRP